MSCSAFGCKQRQYQGCSINFFRFPLRDRRRLKQWVMNVRRQNWTPTPASRLCSMHFEEDQFLIDNMFRRRLKDTAVPTIFNFPPHLRKKEPPPRPTLNRSTGGVNDPLVSPADHYIVVVKQETVEEADVVVKQETAEETNFVEYGDIVRVTVGEVITDDMTLSDSPAKLKHQVRVLHEKLVLARKKFKLKCQQTRRMQSKLVSLKEETKALKTKLDDAEKQMAALSQKSINNGGKRRKAKAIPKEAKHPLKQQLLPTALIEIAFPAPPSPVPTSTQQDLK
ncbi:hypothetical protein PFLUV_G00173040 [Perca fluviatilis]|uniref:THAP domain-containing protein 1 n=1 Tax=Perca fluviatilis TaxID=8168 RepID=A0A6A5EJR5_PERFL|nr:hypothetical protein PFLUV_G00173040 [Perca fluviatilis]